MYRQLIIRISKEELVDFLIEKGQMTVDDKNSVIALSLLSKNEGVSISFGEVEYTEREEKLQTALNDINLSKTFYETLRGAYVRTGPYIVKLENPWFDRRVIMMQKILRN